MTRDRAAAGGWTLAECAAVCAVAAVLTAVALPTWRGQTLRAGRLDAVQALTRLQLAQERHRSTFGAYAQGMPALGGVAEISPQGLYTISVAASGPETYLAVARPRGSQSRDSGCPVLTLEVSEGYARPGPSPQCWNR